MEAIVAVTAVLAIAALILSFVWVEDADAPMGDGMILGCLLLAVPLWPITMPLWLLYLVKAPHRPAPLPLRTAVE